MGVKGLREAFNGVAAPTFNCTVALLDTMRAHDAESTILTFIGTKHSGEKFQLSSRPVRPSEDVYLVAAEVAQQLLNEESKQ